jgi:hypothetical protein
MAGTETEQRDFYFYFYFFEVSKNLGLEKSVRDWSLSSKERVMSLVRRERGSGGVSFR